MKLLEALGGDKHLRLAIVGAGGKTSAMFGLAREMEGKVILCASAHLAVEQAQFADRHFIVSSPADIDNHIFDEREDVVLFTGPIGKPGRTSGLNQACLERIRSVASEIDAPVIIEADGSRRRPLKAPYETELPIPAWVKEVLVVYGLSGCGKMVDEDQVYNPEKFAELNLL